MYNGESIMHLFAIDLDSFYDPKDNIQFSLGGKHSGHKDQECDYLTDVDGKKVKSYRLEISCKFGLY
jgi:hypothetical protein